MSMRVSKSAVPSIHNRACTKTSRWKPPRDLFVNSMGALAQNDGLNDSFIQLMSSTEGDCSNKVQMGLLRECVEAAPCMENSMQVTRFVDLTGVRV